MSELPIVSIVTFLPLVGVALLLCLDRQREAAIKHLAFGVSVVTVFFLFRGKFMGT